MSTQTLPTKAEAILSGLLALAEEHGDAEVFGFLGALLSAEGRTEVTKVRMVLARRVLKAHDGDQRAAAEALGYWAKGRDDARRQTISNFAKLVNGVGRDGRQLLDESELNR